MLILTNYDTDADILGAIEAGACGYLLKDAGPDLLLAGIRAAARGDALISPSLTLDLLSRRTGSAPAHDDRVARLSDREAVEA